MTAQIFEPERRAEVAYRMALMEANRRENEKKAATQKSQQGSVDSETQQDGTQSMDAQENIDHQQVIHGPKQFTVQKALRTKTGSLRT